MIALRIWKNYTLSLSIVTFVLSCIYDCLFSNKIAWFYEALTIMLLALNQFKGHSILDFKKVVRLITCIVTTKYCHHLFNNAADFKKFYHVWHVFYHVWHVFVTSWVINFNKIILVDTFKQLSFICYTFPTVDYLDILVLK